MSTIEIRYGVFIQAGASMEVDADEWAALSDDEQHERIKAHREGLRLEEALGRAAESAPGFALEYVSIDDRVLPEIWADGKYKGLARKADAEDARRELEEPRYYETGAA